MTIPKQQIWGSHLAETPDELMVRFCAGRDVTPLPMADAELLPFDLWTNRAHAIMLARQGILDAPVLQAMLAALSALEADWSAGRFALDPAAEDVHVNVERYVSAKAGSDVGGRLHTARSRNDQVATDMRLIIRAGLLNLGGDLAALVETLLELAEAHRHDVMPGFTHHQPAMMTTWGHWLSAYAQSLCRDLERVRQALSLVNRSPLGAAASYGTSWPIDRAFTAELLGFDRVDENTQDAIGARWEHETQAAFTCAMLLNHFAVMAQDLLLLAHPYWGMASLPDRFVTGSSIMPQKRNPDFAEVTKGKAAWVGGMVSGLLAMPKGTMSGYNRDTQWTKYAILDVLRECAPAPALMRAVFQGLRMHPERMRERLNEGFLAAADFADVLARTLQRPFRTCYDVAAAAVLASGDAGRITLEGARQALQAADLPLKAAADVLADLEDPERIISWREHLGSPAPGQVADSLTRLRAELRGHSAALAALRDQCDAALARCQDWKV